MCNMGVDNLTLIDPPDFNIEKVKKTATHESSRIVENIKIVKTIEEAIEQSNYLVGTTARLGRQRQVIISPSQMASKTIPLSHKNNISLLFGPEDKGLSNHEIKYCDCLVNIPTIKFTSINLSQAVMILCYEISKGVVPSTSEKAIRLAGKKELEKMYQYLERVFVESDYTNPENPEFYLLKFRKFFSGLKLKSGEVIILNNLLKKILIKFSKK